VVITLEQRRSAFTLVVAAAAALAAHTIVAVPAWFGIPALWRLIPSLGLWVHAIQLVPLGVLAVVLWRGAELWSLEGPGVGPWLCRVAAVVALADWALGWLGWAQVGGPSPVFFALYAMVSLTAVTGGAAVCGLAIWSGRCLTIRPVGGVVPLLLYLAWSILILASVGAYAWIITWLPEGGLTPQSYDNPMVTSRVAHLAIIGRTIQIGHLAWSGAVVSFLVVLMRRIRGAGRVGHCPRCGYDLRASAGSRCPECGWEEGEGRRG
jgi:hypothetical protein